MPELITKGFSLQPSAAFDAASELDSLKVDVKAASSTAYLLATAESLPEDAQLAFHNMASSLSALAARIGTKSDEFMDRHKRRDQIEPTQPHAVGLYEQASRIQQ